MAYDFDGTDELIASASTLYNITATGLTIALWLKFPNPGGNAVPIGKYVTGTNNRQYMIRYLNSGDDMQFFVSNNGSATINVATSGFNADDDAWHHICATWDPSTTINIYADGANKQTNSTSVPATLFSSAASLTLGAQSTGISNYTGDMAEVGIWNAALNDAEVAALGAGVSPLMVRPASLSGYMPLRGEPTTSIDVLDNTAFSEVGTLTASTTAPTIINPATYKLTSYVTPVASGVAPKVYHQRHHNLAV